MKTSWDVFKAEGFSGTEIESMHGEGAPPQGVMKSKHPVYRKNRRVRSFMFWLAPRFPEALGWTKKNSASGFAASGERRDLCSLIVTGACFCLALPAGFLASWVRCLAPRQRRCFRG